MGPFTELMSLLDRLYSVGKIRRFLWRHWYGFLTRRVARDEVLFLNYAFEQDPPMRLPLGSADEPNRGCIQLYDHVASRVDHRGKSVVEVSCGHGGGASYLARTKKPERYTALDLNADGIRFCLARHSEANLDFVEGDAEQLPFPEESVDVVINVEASHCYASFPQFLAEVKRVLRPGGHFLYADFRFAEDVPKWEDAIAQSALRILAQQDISADVLRGMRRNSSRSAALVARHLPKWLHKLGGDFAGIEGSRVFNALKEGKLSYRSYCFEKMAA